MKTSLATGLSIAGVIVAGGAAMALNTVVLTSKSSSGNLAAAVTDGSSATTADLGAGGVTAEGASAGYSDQSGTASTTFTIGAAGTVTVSVTGATLEVTDITAAGGWTASPPRYFGLGSARVHYTSASQRLDVRIDLVNGVPQVQVVDDTGQPGPVPGFDGEDHEQHEREESQQGTSEEEENDDD